MFRQDLGAGTRKVLMESVVLIVALIENILHAVIQVGLDAMALEFCLEYRVDLGNELGLIGLPLTPGATLSE